MMKKVIFMTVASVALVCGAIYGLYRRFYPYGERTCLMPCTVSSLYMYARDHEGWFPKDGPTPLQSLQMLYPVYLQPPEDLAGISGNEKETVKRLESGQPLDGGVSSWIYFPGFRTNDGDMNRQMVAIIWERHPDIGFNGRRSRGHCVGFSDGAFAQITRGLWPTFLLQQEALRAAILAKRSSENATNETSKSTR